MTICHLQQDSSETRHTILLVDDEADFIATSRRMLKNEPYRLITATSEKEAFELLQKHRIDLVVSDCLMPERDGVTLLSTIQKGYLRTITSYSHHEKWNGSGYPMNLSAEDIPLCGRIMAIADVYDALISKRVYKPPFTHGKAVSIIATEKGEHFDPVLVEAFLEVEEQFRLITLEFADSDEERQALSH